MKENNNKTFYKTKPENYENNINFKVEPFKYKLISYIKRRM